MAKELKKHSAGEVLSRVFQFVKPFMAILILSIMLNITFSTFNAVSIATIKPIFEILFDDEKEEGESSDFLSDTDSLTPGWLSDLKDSFYDTIKSETIVENDKEQSLINLGIFIISIFFFKNFFKYLGAMVSVRIEEGIVKSIRDSIFNKLTQLSLSFYSKARSGNIISILTNDVTVLSQSTAMSLTIVIRDLTQVTLFIALLMGISTRLTIIAFSTSIISLVLIRVAMKFIRRYSSRMQGAMAEFTSTLQETISGVKVIKAFNAQESTAKRFLSETAYYVKSAIKHKKITALVPSINEIFAILALCVVLYVGGTEVFGGTMEANELMTFLFALFSIMSPITTLVNSVTKFQRGVAAADRVFDLLDTPIAVSDGHEKVNSFEKEIKIENLSFSYEEENVLNNVSITINKGRKVALVGASGSGKSTILDLVMRFYDPNSGSISFDGKEIKNFDLKEYRKHFGMVSQESIIFNDTVENNIRFGDSNASMDDIIRVSKIAKAYDFITNMPEGFNTKLGDRGISISGGERQRISIARALLRSPEILIFDEATSALDAESEKIVQDAINQSLENRTAILVAHRLATIIDCDEIIVFDKGRIVERGSHSELLEHQGVYKKLYDIQFQQV